MSEFFSTLMPLPRVIEEREGVLACPARVSLSLSGLADEEAGLLARLAEIVFADRLSPKGAGIDVRLDAGQTLAELAGVEAPLREEAYELVVGELSLIHI